MKRFSKDFLKETLNIKQDTIGSIAADMIFDNSLRHDLNPIATTNHLLVSLQFNKELFDKFVEQKNELDAWHERFPQFKYRPQDDVIALK